MLVRSRPDRCPGVRRLHEAADGLLARVRLPGGLLGGPALRALAAAADDLGDGRLELTSRGNVQLRGLRPGDEDALADRLAAAGLLPSATHEQVRNVVASPLAGIDTPHDLTALVRALDAAIRAEPELVRLSGRFLFALDDGRGDVAPGADLLAVVRGGAGDRGETAWVEGVPCRAAEVSALLVRAARTFLEVRDGDAWHVDAGTRAAIRARLGGAVAVHLPPAPTAPIGRVARHDGGTALVLAAPLGRLTATQAHWLADRAGQVRVTPGRRIVLPVAPDDDGTAVGLVADPASPWLAVSACAGRPRCASALADVQADAAGALHRWPGRRVHWSGCARRCGRPRDTEVDVEATPTGYAVSGTAGS